MRRCPVCRSATGPYFLKRVGVPVHQNLLMSTQAEACYVKRGDLEMIACNICGFAFNAAFDPNLLAYGHEYDNTQSCSPSFKQYMDELIELLIDQRGVRGARVVEVGCGKGQFIRELISADRGHNVGWGFDPSYVGPDSLLNGRLQFRRDMYGPGCESLRADVVVCRHVIEHVPDPLQLLSVVRAALADSKGARVFFETPCLEWILRNRVIWDFFYEHCSLFTAQSLTTAFETCGFDVTDVIHTFGGQYLWLEARVASHARAVSADHDGSVAELARQFARAEQALLQEWKQKVLALLERGPVAIWGAGAKGATFANLIDPHRDRLDCVVDLNPHKQGRYVPGTGHPIIAPGELGRRRIASALLMNPNYRQENTDLLQASGLSVDLVE
jgi:hypothetical protein